MKKNENVLIEFLRWAKLWIEVLHDSGFADRYKLMYEMLYEFFYSIFGTHTFSPSHIKIVWKRMKMYEMFENFIHRDQFGTNRSFIDLFCCVFEQHLASLSRGMRERFSLSYIKTQFEVSASLVQSSTVASLYSLRKSDAISGALLSVWTSILYLCRPCKSATNSSVGALVHVARN